MEAGSDRDALGNKPAAVGIRTRATGISLPSCQAQAPAAYDMDILDNDVIVRS